jgi:hypothetical protein
MYIVKQNTTDINLIMKKRTLSPLSAVDTDADCPHKRLKSSVIKTLLSVEDKLTNEVGNEQAFNILYNKMINNVKELEIPMPLEHFEDTLVARYTLAILYLQEGRTREADEILACLGYRYRLNKDCFQSTRPHNNHSCSSSKKNDLPTFMRMFDNILPSNQLEALEGFFNPKSVFWSEHNYPNCGYFSYAFPNFVLSKPSNLIESIILRFIYPVVKQEYPLFDPVHCEWWAHSRDVNGGSHQLHYDTDEKGLKTRGVLDFPFVSTVLYFDDFGSPTLITEKKVGDDVMVSNNAYLTFPSRNRLIMFEGNRLHGVVPKRITGFENKRRLTFMVGFWNDNVCVSDFDGATPTANMTLPKNTHRTKWLTKLIKLQHTITAKETNAICVENDSMNFVCRSEDFKKVENVWVDINNTKSQKNYSVDDKGKNLSCFIGKYFIKQLNDLDSDIALMSFDSTLEADELLKKSNDFFPLYLSSVEFILRVFDDDEELKETAQSTILTLTKHSAVVVDIMIKSRMWRDFLHQSLDNESDCNAKIVAAAVLWNLFERKSFAVCTKDYNVFRHEFGMPLITNFKKAPADLESFQGVKELCAGALAYQIDIVETDQVLKSKILEILQSSLKHHLSYNLRNIEHDEVEDTTIIDFENAIKALKSTLK